MAPTAQSGPAARHEASTGLYPRVGLHGQLVHELGKRIGQGEIRPGDPLPPIDQMLGRFGVSRTSIREAMRVLAAKGLIELRQRTGGRVRSMHFWNLLDPDVLAWMNPVRLAPGLMAELAEVRLAIEPQAAAAAAERGTVQDVAAITAQLERMVAHTHDADLQVFYSADLAFHAALFDASHNRFLTQLGRGLLPALERAFDLHRVHTVERQHADHLRQVTCPMHRAVLDAIREHDRVQAEAAMRRVIQRALDDLAFFEGRGPDPWARVDGAAERSE